MALESTSGRNVKQHFGPRLPNEPSMGRGLSNNVTKELRLNFKGSDVLSNVLDIFDEQVLPAGALVRRVVVDIKEVFVVGGTAPILSIGTEGSEATNGFDISEAELEAAASVVISSFNGTWAATLVADTPLGSLLGGTTPSITAAGVANIVIEYDLV